MRQFQCLSSCSPGPVSGEGARKQQPQPQEQLWGDAFQDRSAQPVAARLHQGEGWLWSPMLPCTGVSAAECSRLPFLLHRLSGFQGGLVLTYSLLYIHIQQFGSVGNEL